MRPKLSDSRYVPLPALPALPAASEVPALRCEPPEPLREVAPLTGAVRVGILGTAVASGPTSRGPPPGW